MTKTGLRRTLVALSILALVAEGVYLVLFTGRFPLVRLYATLPPVDYAKLTDYRLSDAALLVGAYGLVLAGLGWLLSRVPLPPARPVVLLILAAAVVFGGTLFWVYPVFAIDMLFYALHARLWVLYGASPLKVAPAQFPEDPWIALKGEWVNVPSTYSPLWEVLGAIPAWLFGPENMLAIMLGLKGIALLAYLANVVLIAAIAARLWPDNWPWRVVFFAWNPLVLLELVANGHNDGVMLAFLLLAVWWWLRGREGMAHAAMALSTLIKLPPVFLWPFLWLEGLLRRRGRESLRYTAKVALVVGGTVGVFLLFLWPDPLAWQAFREGDTAGRSPQALAILVAMAQEIPRAYTRVQRVFQGLFVALYVGLMGWFVRRVRAASPESLALSARWGMLGEVWWWVLVALIGVFASNWRPWYGTWLIALAALLPAPAVHRSAFVLSFTALVGDVFWTNVAWQFDPYLPQLLRHVIGVGWVFGVPVLAYVWPKSWQMGCHLPRGLFSEEKRSDIRRKR